MTTKKLNELIHARDNDSCLLCGRWVHPGNKWHHIVFKSQGGKDSIENGATLCIECHARAHGFEARKIREELKAIVGSVASQT